METNQNIKNEAIERIHALTEKYNLNPHILEYFVEGKIYYSYLTAGGLIASIDSINYDERYKRSVENFEKEYKGYLVYHAIHSDTPFGEQLALLYVSKDKESWEMERESNASMFSYVVNLTYPEISKFGEIKISNLGESGALVRIG